MDWLRVLGKKKKKKQNGSMTSAAHEYLVLLLNDWAGFGNLLMPRDLLLKVSSELVEAVNETETAPERKFNELWKLEDGQDFEPIKKQYERMLSLLPESHTSKWKERVGIDKEENSKTEEEEKDAMQEEKEEKDNMQEEEEEKDTMQEEKDTIQEDAEENDTIQEEEAAKDTMQVN
jgi:hypothetical protein